MRQDILTAQSDCSIVRSCFISTSEVRCSRVVYLFLQGSKKSVFYLICKGRRLLKYVFTISKMYLKIFQYFNVETTIKNYKGRKSQFEVVFSNHLFLCLFFVHGLIDQSSQSTKSKNLQRGKRKRNHCDTLAVFIFNNRFFLVSSFLSFHRLYMT